MEQVDENGWVITIGKVMHIFFNEENMKKFLKEDLQKAIEKEEILLAKAEKRRNENKKTENITLANQNFNQQNSNKDISIKHNVLNTNIQTSQINY